MIEEQLEDKNNASGMNASRLYIHKNECAQSNRKEIFQIKQFKLVLTPYFKFEFWNFNFATIIAVVYSVDI